MGLLPSPLLESIEILQFIYKIPPQTSRTSGTETPRFTFVSYNILSQTLLNDHGYLYTNCNPRDLEWPKRGHRIVSELIANKADIICLQEVENEHLRTLYRPKLAQFGYNCLYKRKTGYKIDGCAIFFKSKRFELLGHRGVEFRRTDLEDILNRDNIGIIAILKPRSSKIPRIVIANTHLLYNPRRCDIRLAQLKLFLSELNSMAAKSGENQLRDENEHSHFPTILCGDFNSLPDSDEVRFILRNQSSQESVADAANENSQTESRVQDGAEVPPVQGVSRLDGISHPFKFKSVYPTHDKSFRPYISTFSGCVVDYIFYTTRFKVESYLELLTDDKLREMDPIPSADYPSDHIPLKARFMLNYDPTEKVL